MIFEAVTSRIKSSDLLKEMVAVGTSCQTWKDSATSASASAFVGPIGDGIDRPAKGKAGHAEGAADHERSARLRGDTGERQQEWEKAPEGASKVH
jgi:hypothetical protein